jgi:AAA family ATP:ADP antiporter
MMSIFIGFFFLFSIFLYPCRDILHPHELADTIQSYLPVGLKGLIAIFRNWTYSAFYVMAEMWSTIIMTILAWGFANDVTSVKDAKRFYGVLGIAINISGIAAGHTVTVLSQTSAHPLFNFIAPDAWGQSMFFLNSIIIASSILCVACFKYMHVIGHGYNSETFKHHHGDSKVKMGLRKNFAYLAKSKYLVCLAVIVVMYNIAINLVEVVWKDQMKQLCPNPGEFNAYMGQVLTAGGIVATVVSIFVLGVVIRKFSWKASALISPVIMVITGIGFFSFILFKDTSFGSIATWFGVSPLAAGVFFGSMQNCLARASKYTFFDATKEIAFIPLSKECKLKGKAAIDGVGSRLGKSGGSVIHQGLLMFSGTVALSTPYVGFILLGVIAAWIFAVKGLGKQFNALVSQHETISVSDEEPSSTKEKVPQPLGSTT